MKTRKELVYCERDPNNHNHENCLTKPQHTPTPWKVSQTGNFVMHSRPGTVLNVCEASIEDAAYIVLAVNSHKGLLSAAKRAFDLLSEQDDYGINGDIAEELQKAIAKAEGK